MSEPMHSVNLWLPLALIERIKHEARVRAIHETRHVPYVELIRQSLNEKFPEPKPEEKVS